MEMKHCEKSVRCIMLLFILLFTSCKTITTLQRSKLKNLPNDLDLNNHGHQRSSKPSYQDLNKQFRRNNIILTFNHRIVFLLNKLFQGDWSRVFPDYYNDTHKCKHGHMFRGLTRENARQKHPMVNDVFNYENNNMRYPSYVVNSSQSGTNDDFDTINQTKFDSLLVKTHSSQWRNKVKNGREAYFYTKSQNTQDQPSHSYETPPYHHRKLQRYGLESQHREDAAQNSKTAPSLLNIHRVSAQDLNTPPPLHDQQPVVAVSSVKRPKRRVQRRKNIKKMVHAIFNGDWEEDDSIEHRLTGIKAEKNRMLSRYRALGVDDLVKAEARKQERKLNRVADYLIKEIHDDKMMKQKKKVDELKEFNKKSIRMIKVQIHKLDLGVDDLKDTVRTQNKIRRREERLRKKIRRKLKRDPRVRTENYRKQLMTIGVVLWRRKKQLKKHIKKQLKGIKKDMKKALKKDPKLPKKHYLKSKQRLQLLLFESELAAVTIRTEDYSLMTHLLENLDKHNFKEK